VCGAAGRGRVTSLSALARNVHVALGRKDSGRGNVGDDGLQTRIGASALTLGGLLKHLAFVEDYTFTSKLRGEPPGAPWDPTAWDDDEDWEFTSAADDTPGQLYALWDGAVERSRARLAAALAGGGLAQLVHVSGPDGRHASLRRLVCDLIEEYGRHTGHADLLREAVDGLAGEDPPAGWRVKRTDHVTAADRRTGGQGAAGLAGGGWHRGVAGRVAGAAEAPVPSGA
jgi:hypothetical protein